MGLWVAVDDNIGLAELVGGAVAAALAALLTEVALHQAGTPILVRVRWLAAAYRLPGQVLGDTVLVFHTLARPAAARRAAAQRVPRAAGASRGSRS